MRSLSLNSNDTSKPTPQSVGTLSSMVEESLHIVLSIVEPAKIYNTGRPMTEEFQAKLFLKPLPPKDRKETNPDGMGLGLHLAKQIIQTHGRDIWHEPDTGRTAFILAIPKEISDTHFTTHTKDTLFS